MQFTRGMFIVKSSITCTVRGGQLRSQDARTLKGQVLNSCGVTVYCRCIRKNASWRHVTAFNFIFNIPLCGYRLKLTNKWRQTQHVFYHRFFFLCNGYMFRQTILSSSDHSMRNMYTKVLVWMKSIYSRGTKKMKIKILKCFMSNVSGLTGRYCNKMF
jgi:hypothetical protein